MTLRRSWLWIAIVPWLAACQCEAPATAPLPWQGASCFSPQPFCPSKLLCQGGVWQCISCIDNETKPCYEGGGGTVGVGTCKEGISTCSFGTWGACVGQVIPTAKDACGNNLDDNCNGEIDEGCDCDPNGPPRVCGIKEGLCQQGTQNCSANGKWEACVGNIEPAGELCDGLDNDCDGQVDENFKKGTLGNRGLSEPCESGVGACKRPGVYVCSADGTNVECNAPKVAPGNEVCDGKDNDCNGQVDEKWPNKGNGCDNGQKGICFARGKLVCRGDGKGLRCNAPTPKSQDEVCDGKDNDCNGQVDDNPKDQGGKCDVGGKKGVCKEGTRQCENGSLVCKSKHQSGNEVCDGKDNDCDGQTDESFNGKGDSCTINGASPPCDKGTKECVNGKVECKAVPVTNPQQEVCDGKDNDCNGQVDDGLGKKPCSNKCPDVACNNGKWDDCKCCSDGDEQSCDPPGGCDKGKRKCKDGGWDGRCEEDCD